MHIVHSIYGRASAEHAARTPGTKQAGMSRYERDYLAWYHYGEHPLKRAHKRSLSNEVHLLASTSCGCFRCLAIFHPKQITRWVNDRDGRTALCPTCGIDSVLDNASGYPITVPFLKEMQARYFG